MTLASSSPTPGTPTKEDLVRAVKVAEATAKSMIALAEFDLAQAVASVAEAKYHVAAAELRIAGANYEAVADSSSLLTEDLAEVSRLETILNEATTRADTLKSLAESAKSEARAKVKQSKDLLAEAEAKAVVVDLKLHHERVGMNNYHQSVLNFFNNLQGNPESVVVLILCEKLGDIKLHGHHSPIFVFPLKEKEQAMECAMPYAHSFQAQQYFLPELWMHFAWILLSGEQEFNRLTTFPEQFGEDGKLIAEKLTWWVSNRPDGLKT